MRRLAAGLAVLLLTACGVPQDDAPRAVQAPFGVPSATAAPDGVGPGRVALYFVRDGEVVLTTRPVRASTPTPDLLDLLFAGTSADERDAGLVSFIPANLTLEEFAVQGGTAVLTLGGPDEEVQRIPPLAYAQIVATLTPHRAQGVRFRLDDADLPVPRSDGSLTDAPLGREDYADLIAAPASAAPTPSA